MADCLNASAMAVCLALALSGSAQAELNDPTRPPPGFSAQDASAAAPPQAAALVVSSLFLMGDKPYAVVDGVIVRPGDPLAEGKVARIDADGVWLRINGAGKGQAGLRQLKWLPEVVKTPSKVRMEKKR